jgi:kynurenine formamidase
MATINIPTEEEVLGYMTSLSNWGRWGPDDELGTLNLITPQKRAQAAGLVREGISVTCSRLIVPEGAADVTSIPPLHYMIRTGESAPNSGPGGSSDFIGFSFHGLTITHLDALCHQFWDGKMYNGKPASLVKADEKATAGHVDRAQNGIVTRGVLLDITKVRGKEWLDAGEAVFTEDLEAAERTQGVRVEEGDALILRLGWAKRRLEQGPPASGRPGLHAETLPWLHQRGVSMIVADASQDVDPNGYPKLGLPVHRVGIVGMGLWLIDAANCEGLVEVCQRLNRWEFMFNVAPLRFHNATGSPVNPLAIF